MRNSPIFALVALSIGASEPADSRSREIAAIAGWSTDTTIGNPVALVTGDQISPIMVADGAGGFIVLWTDFRKPGFDPDLYCQRVSASGDTLWNPGGVVLCDAPGVQQLPTLIADGQGGAFAAWMDLRSSGSQGYYLQHIAGNGVRRWAANGLRPVNGFHSQHGPRICLDGAGGIFLAFASGAAPTAVLQRLDSLGVRQIPGEGVSLRSPASLAAIVEDGSGGAIVAMTYGAGDIAAQRVTANGTLLWGPAGTIVTAAVGVQGPLDMASDGAGGAVLAWVDNRTNPADVYAQRVSAGGTTMWTADGAPVCTFATTQTNVRLRGLADGGAVVVWRDDRHVAAGSIYAQRMGDDGTPAWDLDGVRVGAGTRFIVQHALAPADGEGTFVVWNSSPGEAGDVFAQRIDGDGARQWVEYAATVCHGPNDQTAAVAATDGRGGLYVAYRDRRVSDNADIYAHHLDSSGLPNPVVSVPGGPAARDHAAPGALRGFPNPAHGAQLLAFTRPVAAGARVEVHDLTGRRRLARGLPEGVSSWSWDGRGDDGVPVGAGLYFVRVSDGARVMVGRVVRLD